MKFNTKKWLVAIGFGCALAGQAEAELVAGWDFSDLSGDSAAVPGAYAANLTQQATASSLSVTGDVIASAMRPGGSVKDAAGLEGGINGYASTQDPTFPVGTDSFGGGAALGLTARGVATLEFDTSLAAVPTNEWWVATLGATSLAQPADGFGDSTTVDVSFGATCGSASPISSVTVTPEDTELRLFLGAATSAGGCLVLDVDGSTNQPLIDNVALTTVPEPGMGMMVVAGIAGLLGLSRRKAE